MKINKSEDRKYLKKLAQALDISEGRIKLDECRDWNIFGVRGKISTDGEYWYLYTSCETKMKWTYTKKKLSWMEVHQDGDDEGILRLDRMPYREEAKSIRQVIGLRTRIVLSEEDVALLKIRLNTPSKKGVI